jgi:hypothetical protein
MEWEHRTTRKRALEKLIVSHPASKFLLLLQILADHHRHVCKIFRDLEGAVVSCFKTLPQHPYGGCEKKYEE